MFPERTDHDVLVSTLRYYKEQSHNRALHLLFLYGMAFGAAITFVVMLLR